MVIVLLRNRVSSKLNILPPTGHHSTQEQAQLRSQSDKVPYPERRRLLVINTLQIAYSRVPILRTSGLRKKCRCIVFPRCLQHELCLGSDTQTPDHEFEALTTLQHYPKRSCTHLLLTNFPVTPLPALPALFSPNVEQYSPNVYILFYFLGFQYLLSIFISKNLTFSPNLKSCTFL